MKTNLTGIQIIGTQRSGSNLLRVMLDQSPEISALHPPHILQNFVPLMKYFNTSDDDEYRMLVKYVIEFIRYNPVPWEGVELNIDGIASQAQSRSIYELFRIIYEEAARQRGKVYWCCKSMVNFRYFSRLEAEGIQPKCIYLYRDGRDVALSFKKTIVGEKHVYHLAQHWRNDQLSCIRLMNQLGPKRCFALSYEDFILNPENTIRMICEFLEIEFWPAMLEYHTSGESKLAASSGQMWANLTKPVMEHNKRKFLQELTAEEQEVFELIAGDVLSELGYPLYYECRNLALISEDAIAQYDLDNKMLKANMQGANRNDFQSRNGQRNVLDSVKSRFAQTQIVL